MELVYIWLKLVGLMNAIVTFSHLVTIQGREPFLGQFCKQLTVNVGWHSENYGLNLIQTYYDDRHHRTPHFDTHLNDLDVHCREQFHNKSKIICANVRTESHQHTHTHTCVNNGFQLLMN